MTSTNQLKDAKSFPAALANWPWWLQWLIFTLASLLIYLPIIGNSFVSDDFLVIRKLALEGKLNTNGFFRPLSDITLWLNYQIGGLNPFVYYLTGILLRGLSVMLLFRFCQRLQFSADKNLVYGASLAAALFFLSYPFHNESVAWLLGRGALMAGIFALGALLFLTSQLEEKWKISGACCCYFIGLAAYETIVILPGLVLAYMLFTQKPVRHILRWQFFLLLTLASHIALRVTVSGSMSGEYGAAFFNRSALDIFIYSGIKALARLVVPPMEDSRLFILLAVIAAAAMLIVVLFFFRKTQKEFTSRTNFKIILSCLLIALAIACFGGVSTRNSESDRFLELPAVFFSMLTALVIFRVIERKSIRLLACVVLIAYQLIFLQLNNQNWSKASASVREFLQIASQKKQGQQLVVINPPGDIRGAYVFRNGLKDALVLYNIDASELMIFEEQNPGNVKALADSLAQANGDKNRLIIYWDKENWTVHK